MADKIRWCIRQKRGIELIEPSENLAKAYLQKAEKALESMKANEGNTEWEIPSGYYAMYFSVYAILMRLGVKSEIHSCTIEFVRVYLNEYFTDEEMELLATSQEARIDAQYYVGRRINIRIHQKIIREAPDLMIKCKNILPKISDSKIGEIREDLRKKISG
ncbi:MAG: HEPN domain-containing protein [Candidatus Altiarchaeota archaeon]